MPFYLCEFYEECPEEEKDKCWHSIPHNRKQLCKNQCNAKGKSDCYEIQLKKGGKDDNP